MRTDAIMTLRQVRQARADGAAAALRRAMAAQDDAATLRRRADEAAKAFATTRRTQEAMVQQALSAGPIESQCLRQAAAQLSGLAAFAGVLRQRSAAAAAQEEIANRAASAARGTRIAAERAALGVALLHRRLDAVVQAAGEHGLDAELDAVAGRRGAAAIGRTR